MGGWSEGIEMTRDRERIEEVRGDERSRGEVMRGDEMREE